MIDFVKRNDIANKDGLYAVRLRITKHRQRKYLALGLFAAPEEWDESNQVFVVLRNLKGEKQKEQNEQRKGNNVLLERYKVRARAVIDDFDRDHIDWTLNQFEDAFLNHSRKGKVADYFAKHIEVLQSTGRIGNANCYQSTLRMLGLFDSRFEGRVFSEIDIKYVKAFDIFLQKRACNGNTRKFYFKALRSILNKAIQDKEASAHSYPFGKGGFEVAKLEESTSKRYLTQEHLSKLKSTEGLIPQTEFARKLFLFSYYCYGMSFVDMAQLSTSNTVEYDDGRYIVYKRQKIKHQKNVHPIKIKITLQIEALIKELRQTNKSAGNYLLPIVTAKQQNAEKLYNHIRDRYKKYNNALVALGQELGFSNIKLTTYVSRHTMAMTLQSNNVTREVISQILGHTDMETTNTYLDSFDSSIINEAAKVL